MCDHLHSTAFATFLLHVYRLILIKKTKYNQFSSSYIFALLQISRKSLENKAIGKSLGLRSLCFISCLGKGALGKIFNIISIQLVKQGKHMVDDITYESLQSLKYCHVCIIWLLNNLCCKGLPNIRISIGQISIFVPNREGDKAICRHPQPVSQDKKKVR